MDIRLNAVAEESLRCALRTWLAIVNRYGYIGDYEVLQHLIEGRLRVSRDNKDYAIVVDNGTDNEEYASYLVYTARRCGGGCWQLQLEQAATIVPVFDPVRDKPRPSGRGRIARRRSRPLGYD